MTDAEAKDRRIAQLERQLVLARKHLRDSFMGAALTGLIARGDIVEDAVELSELAANKAMRQLRLWEVGQSVNEPPRDAATLYDRAMALRVKGNGLLEQAERVQKEADAVYAKERH